jgi:hypothetical protein
VNNIKTLKLHAFSFYYDELIFVIHLCYGVWDDTILIHKGNVLPVKATDVLESYYVDIIENKIKEKLEETENARY